MNDLSRAQRKAWANHVKAVLVDAGADLTRLNGGGTRIALAGNVIVVRSMSDMGVRMFRQLLHRSG